MRRNRRRAFVPSLDSLAVRVAPAAWGPPIVDYPDMDLIDDGRWVTHRTDELGDPTGVDLVVLLQGDYSDY